MKAFGLALALGVLGLITWGCESKSPAPAGGASAGAPAAKPGTAASDSDELEAEKRVTEVPALPTTPVDKLPVRTTPLPQDPFSTQPMPGLPGGSVPVSDIQPPKSPSRAGSTDTKEK